jgi:hypothetical protein
MRRTASSAIGAVLALALASAVVVLTPSPALPQAYPQPCNVLSGTQVLGDVRVGDTFTFQLAPQCTFTVGASATVDVNGVVFTKAVNASGFVEVTVRVVSENLLEVNPQAPARCGTNTISATAPSAVAGGQPVTQTAVFNLLCGAAPRAATPVRGRLSLTGTDVLPWAAAALALLVVGALLVTASRRRASARS